MNLARYFGSVFRRLLPLRVEISSPTRRRNLMRTSFGDLLADLVIEALTEGPRTGFEIATILEDRFGTSLRTREGRWLQHQYRLLPSLRGREGALYAELMQLVGAGS